MDRDALERIRAALVLPSYTPARRDLAAVADIIASDDDATATAATKALLRAGSRDALGAVDAALAAAAEPGAVRLVAALGQLGRTGATDDVAVRLAALLDDPRARVRRAAVVALGKTGGDRARDALVAYAGREDLTPDHRRAVVESLGKVGGDAAAARLGQVSDPADLELERRRRRALLILERDAARSAPSTILGGRGLPADTIVACRCRRGLEGLLDDELRAAGLPIVGSDTGVVRVSGGVALDRFQAARTWITVGIERAIGAEASLEERIARAVVDAAALLAELTDGVVKWRLAFEGGGHRRGLVWDVAQRVRREAPDLINDPTATTWEVVVSRDERSLELRPRRLEDRRFSWRVADVSASSHPTVAAALARFSGVRHWDVVWDPFCGSGAEVVERGLLGPAARLCGSDLDARALDAARRNVEAAGLRAEMVLADALVHDPGGVTAIVTNPPLGRRLRGDPGALLERFVAHAARIVAPGGRLVWITPVAARTERAARRAGWRLDERRTVDLGGFDGELERWFR